MRIQPAPWEVRAAAKRASTLSKIPEAWRLSPADLDRAKSQRDLTGPFIQQFLQPDEISIVSKDSVEIVNEIKEGNLSAVQVTTAFCKTAAVAHQINNYLHEIFFDQALERAKELDALYAEKGETIGPLHGLPISVKDQFHVKGVDTTMGYVGWIGSNLGIKDPSQIHQVESQITAELLSLGAVLFCKTSLPQTLLMGETKNNIIGQTMNPHNQNLSCGGSSGGEGALQALRGSTLGLGTDIAGSVRIPATFCGIFALKPTAERLSYRDAANTNPGQNTYRSTVGFLSTSPGGLELALRSILSTRPWERDPAVVPIPFRQEVVDKYRSRADGDGKATQSELPLKLGVLWTDGVLGPHPPILRGLRELVDALRQAGHKIVDWNPPSHATGRRIHISMLTADGAQDIHSHLDLSGEPLIPDLQEQYPLKPPMSLLEYQNLTIEGLEYEAAYSDYWNSTAAEDGQIVDAVIMPAAPHAAVIPGKYHSPAYTEVINVLNYSAVAIPVTKADKSIDVVDKSYVPLSDHDKLNWDDYDPEIYHGAPVGLQLVARKFEEEKILAIADIVVAALQAYRKN
ncbi:amidase signature domain-containing protein [Chaetomium strumarium]|uniref:Amidase signature domain-containing protein n=1 Tax=Chaetomium strumarium TaxID=1170767 RepID=A0AAJ0GW64_9PEZI|nr:amidase signature domain-containing protein [Chaetomium strumarium]